MGHEQKKSDVAMQQRSRGRVTEYWKGHGDVADCRATGSLHTLRRGRQIGNGGADAHLKVCALERVVIDAIGNPSNLALDRGEAIIKFVDCRQCRPAPQHDSDGGPDRRAG